MPSGYEQSSDYGGPEPKPWLWVLEVVGLVALTAAYLYFGL